jgi:two-component system, OmpR family, phosphate regulon sensor histidine kinase PhoR
MDKKVIWSIVGLMAIAVIGVVSLQMSLIRTAIQENEQRFDRNVFNAMAAVVNRLEYEELNRHLYASVNGYVTNYVRSEVIKYHQEGGGTSLNMNLNFGAGNSHLVRQFQNRINDACTCSKCLSEKENPIHRFMHYYAAAGRMNLGLDERINANSIAISLNKELINRGIETEYTFGIYSERENRFTMIDGDEGDYLPQNKFLLNSRYKVNLFPGDQMSPGFLMLFFPQKVSYVWSSMWLYFLGSILFSAVILFSFAYTIHVIFRQKKLSEMKNDFINNMTHEFKTPLATISLASDSIINPLVSGDPEKIKRYAQIIKQENKRMNHQVEKVLQMAQMDRDEFSLKIGEVDFEEIIETAIENISLQVEKKSGKATYKKGAETCIVEGDHIHLANVINNLLDNANKYSPETPTILVTTRNVRDGIEISIQDQGIGMTKESKKYIFDKFYRVHTGNLHDVKGFGLGLSYVKAIVGAHQGSIEVKSELGKGSTFILFFPFFQPKINKE